MENLETARKNCANTLANFYSDYGLLADMLGDNGEYRAFWEVTNEIVVEAKSNNIFDGQGFTCIYELQYTQPCYGWPTAS